MSPPRRSGKDQEQAGEKEVAQVSKSLPLGADVWAVCEFLVHHELGDRSCPVVWQGHETAFGRL